LVVNETLNPELTELLKESLFLKILFADVFKTCSSSSSDECLDGAYSLCESEESPLS